MKDTDTTVEPEEFQELAREIRNLLKENRKFLDRVLEEDFEPEPEGDEGGETSEDFEEL